MLSTPLTPPYGDSADNIENDSSNGRMLTGESDSSYTSQPFALATPTSNSSMMFNESSEEYTPGGRSFSEDMMEESDQDMSDGGAPLTTIPSHAEELTTDMDPGDSENTYNNDPAGLHNDSQSQFLANPSYLQSFLEEINVPSELGGSLYPFGAYISLPLPEAINTTDLPAVMSEVSQQLQHIQDGQEHGDFESTPDEHHDMFINYNQSTPPASFVQNCHVQDPLNQELDGSLTWYDPSAGGALFTLATSPQEDREYVDQVVDHVAPYETGLDINYDAHNLFETDADQALVDSQFNMNFGDFLNDWATSFARRGTNNSKPSQAAITAHILAENFEPMRRCDLQGEECDIQRIDWTDLGVTRLEARQRRRATYKNYTNLVYPNRPQLNPRQLHGTRLRNVDNYFKFRQMDFQHDVYIRHFQLRNLITCPSQNCVIYAAKTKVLHYDPTIESTPRVLMDLGNPRTQSFHSSLNGCQVSTLTSGHEIVVAGGFEGQYALISTRARKDAKHTEGVITEHPNDITNHAQVHLSRSSSPLVTFASNDSGIRTLDVTTNKFISEHMYDHAMNCTAVSPDRRLRVLVGDTRKVMICNSETGQTLQELEGHLDFGFACDWSEDGWTVATGNQDMQVKIWDARYWNRPVASIAADMAGVRKLKFSPLGSGRPILVAAEPADYVNIINAETFDSKQTLSFFGEVGGFDFTNDGQELVVANCDTLRGGIIEYERCDFATEGLCGKDEQLRNMMDDDESRFMMAGRKRDYGTSHLAEELLEESLALRGTTKRRERRAALLTNLGSF
ncbi:putative wd domain-containing protein [Botrytis fragariae]|uniref:Putative wd domain-containing protein n=1 Tax=Botrytis fragariae TaxID=1964551 RepID=A0A8H6B3C8_9HELO|nr:putative wd domain-containing protein [Botrytis fragariae]KAF5878646.1 putative wd domain-containing protein [Botrytis fragariae]